jgi:gamma-butyrobetaine dioxygenase
MSSGENSDRSTIDEAVLEDGRVAIRWRDGHRSLFHSIWLRHSQSRPFVPGRDAHSERHAGHDGATPRAVDVTSEGHLRVTWSPSGEVGEFEAAWLRDHCNASAERAQRRRPVMIWDSALSEDPPRASYERVRTSDEDRLALYKQVLDYGFAIVEDVPAVSGEVAAAGTLFGLVRLSAYGNVDEDVRVEDVRVDPKVTVGTTRSDFLGPHTDTCWRLSLSGLVLMHCLKASTSGGESLLVDGFKVCEILRGRHPEAFDLLSRVPLTYSVSVDNGDEWRALGRVITCDPEGNVVGFRFNERSMAQQDLAEDVIEPVYAALESLLDVLYDQSLWLISKLEPGSLVVMDNQRILHGRTAFDPTSGERHLQHCSVERDVFHNNYRQLARALGDDSWNQVLTWGVF